MKRSLAILFTILSLSIFFNIERGQVDLCGEQKAKHIAVDDAEQSFSQGSNYIDLNGRRGSSATISVSRLTTDRTPSKRNTLDILSGVKIAIANLYSECSYSHSCDFPFEHQPQQGLFLILRNIRI